MLDLDISCLITFYGMTEYLGVWMMSDGKEETVDIDVETLFMISALASHEMCSFKSVFTKQAFGLALPENLDVWSILDTLGTLLTCTENIAAHNQINLAGKTCEIGCLFTGCIATTYYSNNTLAIEETIACGTSRNTHTCIFLLVVKSKILGRSTSSNDDGLCLYLCAIVNIGTMWLTCLCSKIDLGNETTANISTQLQGVIANIVHEFRTSNAFWIPREILNLGGLRKLTSREQALINNRCETAAASIYCGSITSRATANNQNFYHRQCYLAIRYFVCL